MNQNKGFTLAESMMVLAMLSVIIVLVMPVMTSRKIMPEQEQNSVTCIKKEGAANTTSVACVAVEDLCVGNQAKSCSSLVYFADNGTTAEKAAARKVLHEVCDKGGREACKYLVDSCKKDAAVCDISTTTDDMRHYLAMSNTSGNMGRAIVKEIANGYYLLGNSNITAELVSSCNGGNNKTSCSILIENCNNGYGCSNAYNANANRSCKQINEKWPTAIGKNQKKSDVYTLTSSATPTYDSYCDMTTTGGGWTLLGVFDSPGDGIWANLSTFWTNTTTYGTENITRPYSNSEIKTQAWSNLTVNDLLFQRTDNREALLSTDNCNLNSSMSGIFSTLPWIEDPGISTPSCPATVNKKYYNVFNTQRPGGSSNTLSFKLLDDVSTRGQNPGSDDTAYFSTSQGNLGYMCGIQSAGDDGFFRGVCAGDCDCNYVCDDAGYGVMLFGK